MMANVVNIVTMEIMITIKTLSSAKYDSIILRAPRCVISHID